MTLPAIKAVLFDLDGTLVDTAADLLGTLDDLRAELALPPLTAPLPPAMAARGGRGILTAGLPEIGDAEQLLPRYLQIYTSRLARLSRPYDGIQELLVCLRAKGMRLAIVSNKPEGLARLLVDQLDWRQYFGSVVGGDTLAVRKPAPDPVWRACEELGVAAASCVMVGDDRRDIESARAAGCALSIAAAYGYIEAQDSALNWHADRVVTRPPDLHQMLDLI